MILQDWLYERVSCRKVGKTAPYEHGALPVGHDRIREGQNVADS